MNAEFLQSTQLDALKEAAELASKQVVILDTETTGLDDGARIVSICLMDLNGKILLDNLVNPEIPIPAEASRVHGLTNAMLLGECTWPAVSKMIDEVLPDGAILAGWNIGFDLRMLSQADAAYGIITSTFGCKSYDIMLTYSRWFGEWDDYRESFRWSKLVDAAANLGVAVKNSHSAAGDCDLARRVLLNLAARHQARQYLDPLVTKLAIERAAEDMAKAELDRLKKAFEATPEYQALVKELEGYRANIDTLQAEIRAAAIDHYAKTSAATLHPAVKIRATTVLRYDPEAAVSFCMKSLPRAFKLDTTMFEKHAKAVAATAPLDFVTIVKEPQPTIASKLDEWLPRPGLDPDLELPF